MKPTVTSDFTNNMAGVDITTSKEIDKMAWKLFLCLLNACVVNSSILYNLKECFTTEEVTKAEKTNEEMVWELIVMSATKHERTIFDK
jgi:hypothetical protein